MQDLQQYLATVKAKLDTVRDWLDTIKKKYGIVTPKPTEL